MILRTEREYPVGRQQLNDALEKLPVLANIDQTYCLQARSQEGDQCILDVASTDVPRSLHLQEVGEIFEVRPALQYLRIDALQSTNQKTRLPGGVADRKTGGRGISKRIPVQNCQARHRSPRSLCIVQGWSWQGQHRFNGRLDELPTRPRLRQPSNPGKALAYELLKRRIKRDARPRIARRSALHDGAGQRSSLVVFQTSGFDVLRESGEELRQHGLLRQ